MQRSHLAAAALLAASFLLAACADQQPRTNPDPNCPDSASELPASRLYGNWIARIDGQAPAAMVLERH
ncbi:MAG: hypothetical protein JSS56_13625, partial [Proteobacteria bacterium]|nr:hypothetical protein [Pseudomonadota bacterium]